MNFVNGMTLQWGSDWQGAGVLIENAPHEQRLLRPDPEHWTAQPSNGHSREQPPRNMVSWKLPEKWDYERLHPGQEGTMVKEQAAMAALEMALGQVVEANGAPPTHPAVENGFASEARRLKPNISAKAEAKFGEFVAFLQDQIGLTTVGTLVPYCDDTHCGLFVLAGPPGEEMKMCVLPEIPSLWLAPEGWAKAQWRCTSTFQGPFPRAIVPPGMEGKVFVNGSLGDKVPANELERDEGLMYWLYACRLLVYDSDAECELTADYMASIMNGYRPATGRFEQHFKAVELIFEIQPGSPGGLPVVSHCSKENSAGEGVCVGDLLERVGDVSLAGDTSAYEKALQLLKPAKFVSSDRGVHLVLNRPLRCGFQAAPFVVEFGITSFELEVVDGSGSKAPGLAAPY
jgi:hypothetical protein